MRDHTSTLVTRARTASDHRPLAWLMTFVLTIVLLAAAQGARAGVPNKDAVPAYAEEQTMLQVEADSRTPEPGLGSTASGRVHIDRHYLGQYGSSEANVIVQRGGNTWRELRNGPIATFAGMLLVLALLAIFVFYSAVGPARTDAPDSGRRLQRFSQWDRWVHWATAISFLLLALTGLIILFGKVVLLPWMGHDVFAAVAFISKYLHNFAGPLFIACSVAMFFTYLRRNYLRKADWQWVKQGGGLVTHKHVPAGFFNAGEKAWFWLGVFLLGLVMSISGLILNFAVGQTRFVMQVANYLHLLGATFYIVASMGHIYIGTLGTPGAYRAMREGHVDEEWAKAHHQLWYDEVKGGGAPSGPVSGTARGPGNAPRGH